jgi:hypothetical protein
MHIYINKLLGPHFDHNGALQYRLSTSTLYM